MAIAAVVLLLKEQQLRPQFVSVFHRDLSQDPASIMVIEFLHDAVAPRLGHRNEPRFYSLGQAQANQTSHPARVTPTTVENRFVVYLLMLRYPQTTPMNPDTIDGMLPGLAHRHPAP